MEKSIASDLDLDDGEVAKAAASRTLVRGLEILHAVSCGHRELGDLAATLGLTRTTVHRLASTLIDHRLLLFAPRSGYSLTSASQYLNDARMTLVSKDVLAAAQAISRELGWRIPSDETVSPSITITKDQRRTGS